MEVVAALRTLWRFRLAVAVIALFAVAAGTLVAFSYSPPMSLKSRQYHVGLGSATALVDSPSSQVVDLGGQEGISADIASLTARATLLASLMTSSPMKEEIAARAGIPPHRLVVPTAEVPVAAQDLDRRDIYVLRATLPTLDSGQVPIISVSTQAPEPEQAKRLANAAIEVLQKQVESVATSDKVPTDRRLHVRQLGPAEVELQVRGPAKRMAALAAVAIFGAGCAGILMLVALVRNWRMAKELEGDPPAPVAVDAHVNGGVSDHAPQPAILRTPATPPRLEPRVPPPPAQAEAKRSWASR